MKTITTIEVWIGIAGVSMNALIILLFVPGDRQPETAKEWQRLYKQSQRQTDQALIAADEALELVEKYKVLLEGEVL